MAGLDNFVLGAFARADWGSRMARNSLIVVCCLLAAGCGRNYEGLARGPMELRADVAPGTTAQQFSYSHFWTLVMAKRAITPRFERARSQCLKDTSLNCRLLSATLSTDEGEMYALTSARLELLLPHEKLDLFEQKLREPVPGESAGEVAIPNRSTSADSVENAAGDASRKVQQLTAYRDRLALLAKRPNLSIEDIIRLEAEQSRVQGDLDDAMAKLRDLNEGVARERLDVTLTERAGFVEPIARVWRNGTSLLIESTANALQFVIQILPWLPIGGVGIFFASWAWRRFRRRQPKVA
jgi:hypothetical protein